MVSFNSIKNLLWIYKNRNHFKNWKKRKFSSPSPDFVKHQILRNNNLEKCFWIETGTYYGETTLVLSKIAKKVISIEADDRLFKLANERFKKNEKIKIINAKSEDILDKVLNENIEFKNVCIYLDAHLCTDHINGSNTFGNEQTGTPIEAELKIIEKNLYKFTNIKILIDDIRLFDKKFQNYSTKSSLIYWSDKHNFKWTIEHDIMIMELTK